MLGVLNAAGGGSADLETKKLKIDEPMKFGLEEWEIVFVSREKTEDSFDVSVGENLQLLAHGPLHLRITR